MTDFFLRTFKGCKLTGSTFPDVDLSQAAINGGDWSLVNLRSADLHKLDLRRVRLKGADLGSARIDEIDLLQLDLRGVRMDLDQALYLAVRFDSGNPGPFR